MGTPGDMQKKILETGISLSIGAPLGKMKGGLLTGDFERQPNSSL
jgi:hypothetical protein